MKLTGNAQIINTMAKEYGLDPCLVMAMVMVESGNRSNVARYEDHYRWLVDPSTHAKRLGISQETETQLQKFSWGLLQTMGGTVRGLGYMGFLPELCVPQVGVRWGCVFLQQLSMRYESTEEVIASYNAGSPRRNDDGTFVNQIYVDKVLKFYNTIKEVS